MAARQSGQQKLLAETYATNEALIASHHAQKLVDIASKQQEQLKAEITASEIEAESVATRQTKAAAQARYNAALNAQMAAKETAQAAQLLVEQEHRAKVVIVENERLQRVAEALAALKMMK